MVNQAKRRTWKQQRTQSTNRVQMLVSLGSLAFVALGLFIYWITRNDTLATYVAAVSIENYQGTIPSVQSWQSDSLVKAAKEHSFRPFQELKVDNQATHEGQLKSLISELVGKATDRKYPLVLQLRCQSAVRTDNGLQCELLVPSSFGQDLESKKDKKSDRDRYYLDAFLESLLAYPTTNIILLADIADLDFLPAEGVVINPLESAIQATCERLEKKMKQSDQELWIISPVADGQISLRNRDGKTLFQESCEEAFRSSDSDLSLANFHDNIVRYCYRASQTKQTPVMYRVRSSQSRVGPNDTTAQKVKLSIKEASNSIAEKQRVLPTEKPGETAKPTDPANKSSDVKGENKRTHQEGENLVTPPMPRLVSFATQNRSTEKPPESSTQPTPQSSQPSLEIPTPESPQSLWQLRERWAMASENSPWTWIAADYAPMHWRWALYQSTNPKYGIAKAHELKDFLQWDREVHLPSAVGSSVTQLFTQSPASRLWTNSAAISTAKQSDWRFIQREYRKYIRAVSEFLFWRDLIMILPEESTSHRAPQSEESATQQLSQLLVYLKKMRKRIPDNDAQGAVEHWLRVASMTPEDDPLLPLQRWLDHQVKKLEQTKDWTWLDEHRLVTMLSSPMLSHVQRQNLIGMERKKPKVEFLDSSVDINQIVKSGRELLENRGKLFLDCALTCSDLYRYPVPFDTTNQGINEILKSSDTYRDHQEKLIQRLILTDNECVNRWHVYNLAEIQSELINRAQIDPKGSFGIVLLPSNAKAIEVRFNDSYVDVGEKSESTSFLVGVDYVGETNDPLTRCELLWRSDPVIPGLTLRAGNRSTAWKMNEFTPIDINLKSVAVQLIPPNEGIIFPPNTQIFIQSRDQVVGPSIAVFQGARAIELVVRETGSPRVPSFSQTTKSTFQIHGPIFKKTALTYEFLLQNKQPKKRFAALKFSIDRDGDVLIAQSQIVELPPAIPSAARLTPVPFLMQATMKPDELAIITDSELQSIRYEIEEYESLPEVSAATSNRTRNIANPIAKFEGQLELRAQSPLDVVQMADLVPTLRIGDAPRVTLSLKEEKLLPDEIQIRVRTLDGIGDFSEIKTLKKNAPPTTFSLPRLERNTNALFGLDLAEYPRAHFLTLNVNSIPVFSETYHSRLDPLSVKFTAELAKPTGSKPLDLMNDPSVFGATRTLIFPAWIESKGRAPARYSRLRIQGTFDTPPGQQVEWSIRKSNDFVEAPVLQGAWPDRSYRPDISFDDNGKMSLRFDVAELDRWVDISTKLNGDASERFDLVLNAGNKKSSWQLLFDRKPPISKERLKQNDRGRLRTDGVTLYSDSKIVLELDARDDADGSGLESGLISISKTKGRYNENNKLELPRAELIDETSDSGLRFSFSAEAFSQAVKKLNIGYGDCWLHATTFDKAGNQQSDYEPLKVLWKDAPQPKPTQNP